MNWSTCILFWWNYATSGRFPEEAVLAQVNMFGNFCLVELCPPKRPSFMLLDILGNVPMFLSYSFFFGSELCMDGAANVIVT